MTFRQELVERAKGRGARILLPEGADPRVQAAARRLESEGILEPILIGPGGIDPARDPRVPQVAQHLRERRPDRVHDAI
ncbi:MAG TPA: phosphate acyltransferase, partial [Gemmatimonadales bacterium]|nr:phosphate acyltransferase [Gemmatimonadales bacterium]